MKRVYAQLNIRNVTFHIIYDAQARPTIHCILTSVETYVISHVLWHTSVLCMMLILFLSYVH